MNNLATIPMLVALALSIIASPALYKAWQHRVATQQCIQAGYAEGRNIDDKVYCIAIQQGTTIVRELTKP